MVFDWIKIQDIELIKNTEAESQCYQIEINESYGNDSVQYFCNVINGKKSQYFLKELFGYKQNQLFGNDCPTYLVVEFPVDIAEMLKEIADKKVCLKIFGNASIEKEKSLKGKHFALLKWHSITNIEFVDSQLHKDLRLKEKKLQKYMHSGWVDKYSPEEKREIRLEVTSNLSRAEVFKNSANKWHQFDTEILPKLNKLRKLRLKFQALKIKKSNVFPNSMTFIQNPNYSAIYKQNKLLQQYSNVDKNKLENLILIDKIGLVAVSSLYERWVLIQIINVLIEEFNATIEVGWQDKLINAVLSNLYDVEFNLTMEKQELNLVLCYEKQLRNGKRPDYVLDISSPNNDTYQDDNDFSWIRNDSNQLVR